LEYRRRALAATVGGFAAYLLASAVASEADRPSGLVLVKVTPVSGKPFDAVTIGQKNGRAAFLRLTPPPQRHVVRHGEVEFPPGALTKVELTRIVQ
jgi:hypothetical protein